MLNLQSTLKRKNDFVDPQRMKKLKQMSTGSVLGFPFGMQHEFVVQKSILDKGQPLLPPITSILCDVNGPSSQMPTVTEPAISPQTITPQLQQQILDEIFSMRDILDSNSQDLKSIHYTQQQALQHFDLTRARAITASALQDPRRVNVPPRRIW
jgi:hypothetical protein